MGCAGARIAAIAWMWPNARISVMGGEQAANVLLTVKLEQLKREGATMTDAEQKEFMRPTLEKYELERVVYYSRARLWDDGVLDPVETRAALALGIAASMNAPIPEARTSACSGCDFSGFSRPFVGRGLG